VFHCGLVRVPQAWGEEGEAMAEAAWLELPYPEAGVVEADSLEEQSLALAADLPDRPLVLGGCCNAHVGAVEGLAARQGRLSLIWLDAHGDLNTVESSPTGNLWATPLRMLIDSGAVNAEDVALVGARNLDPPEEEFILEHGVNVGEEGIDRALDGTAHAYVAFDLDVLEPSEASVFMPEPGGLFVADAERILAGIRERTNVLGAGFSGASFEPANVIPMSRLGAALGM
jgi:arginase